MSLVPSDDEATAAQTAAGPLRFQVSPLFVEVKIGLKLATATNLLPSAELAMPVQDRCGSGPFVTMLAAVHVAPEFVEI